MTSGGTQVDTPQHTRKWGSSSCLEHRDWDTEQPRPVECTGGNTRAFGAIRGRRMRAGRRGWRYQVVARLLFIGTVLAAAALLTSACRRPRAP